MKKIIVLMLLTAGISSADTHKVFYENSGLKYEIIYENDKQNGCTINTYYQNSSLKKSTSFKNNDKKQCDLLK